jgi:2-succinyl-6-hydroxy-2,4-cyclohexadiene-1-carboxylate synthase
VSLTPATELAHTVVGSGDRLVLVHGFTQSARSFDEIASALSESYEVCAVDLPGHGRSGDVDASDLTETARLLGETGGEAFYLGYSLGGRVCLTLAHARPDLVRGLVLVGATAGIADDDERGARRSCDERLADRLDPGDQSGLGLEAFLDEWLSQPLFAHLSPAQQDRPARRRNTTAGLARSLRTVGAGTQTPTHDRLDALAVPTLLVAGARDTKFAAIAREMAGAIGARATVELIEGVHHAAPFEAPARFIAVVERWLTAQGS